MALVCGGLPDGYVSSIESAGVFTIDTTGISFVDWAASAFHDYAYVDLGVGAISGNFEHQVNFEIYSYDEAVIGFWWGVSNEIGSNSQHTGNRLLFGYDGDSAAFAIKEYYNNGSNNTKTTAYFVEQARYATISRDEAVGSFGRLTVQLFSDSERTSLVRTITHNLAQKNDFRYRYLLMSSGHDPLITTADLTGKVCVPTTGLGLSCCSFAPRTFAPSTETPLVKNVPVFKTVCDFKGQIIIGNLF